MHNTIYGTATHDLIQFVCLCEWVLPGNAYVCKQLCIYKYLNILLPHGVHCALLRGKTFTEKVQGALWVRVCVLLDSGCCWRTSNVSIEHIITFDHNFFWWFFPQFISCVRHCPPTLFDDAIFISCYSYFNLQKQSNSFSVEHERWFRLKIWDRDGGDDDGHGSISCCWTKNQSSGIKVNAMCDVWWAQNRIIATLYLFFFVSSTQTRINSIHAWWWHTQK